jgi:RNA polymerase sigma factor (sigma-70 family)
MSVGNNDDDTRRRVKKAKEVFDKYGDEIRVIIEFNVKDKNLTEDIFQDFFISVVENPIPPDIEDVMGYIYKAVVHDAIDRTRRARIRREGVRSYAQYLRDNVAQQEPQNVVIIAEEVERMYQLIESRLSPRHLRALRQRYGIGRTASCTDAKLKIDERSVSRYLSEAIKIMQRLVLQSEGALG